MEYPRNSTKEKRPLLRILTENVLEGMLEKCLTVVEFDSPLLKSFRMLPCATITQSWWCSVEKKEANRFASKRRFYCSVERYLDRQMTAQRNKTFEWWASLICDNVKAWQAFDCCILKEISWYLLHNKQGPKKMVQKREAKRRNLNMTEWGHTDNSVESRLELKRNGEVAAKGLEQITDFKIR